MLLPVVALFLVAVAAEDFVNLGDLPMQNPDLFEGDIIGVEGDINDKNAITNPNLKWPRARVPYFIDRSLSNVVNNIQKAFNQYHQWTCVRFVPRTNERNYIRMFAGQGCYSMIGCVGGAQQLSLGSGCHHVGTIVHELGHAIGFHHEQNRSDRDNHLIIYWQNIQQGMASQFQKLLPGQNALLTPFDYDSIMLYGETAFTKARGLRTMAARINRRLREVYDKSGLTKSDVLRVNRLYGC